MRDERLRARSVYISERTIKKIKELAQTLEISQDKLIELVLRVFMSLSEKNEVEELKYVTLSPNKTIFRFNIKKVVWDAFKKFARDNYPEMSVSGVFEVAIHLFSEKSDEIFLNNFVLV